MSRQFPCDLCGSTAAIEVPYVRGYTAGQPIHICKGCGFVYVKVRRSAKEIADTWSNEFFGTRYTANIPAIKARQVYVADFINVNIGLKNKKVCDIGSGEGQFLKIIKASEYGARVFAIEASKKNCLGLSRMGIRHFNGTIEEYSHLNAENRLYKADIVTIMWALEACASCREMLSGAYRLLKKGGHVVVATGSRILVPFKKPMHLYFNKSPVDAHAFRFSANTLRGILAICGFEVIHTSRYMDSDILCMIARKQGLEEKNSWTGDDYLKVRNFFRRWHRETAHYI
jgi:SAM-dependent methyltransferase